MGHRRKEVASKPPGAFALVVVCEADADRRTATCLADRVLCEEIEWIEPESLDGYRTWRGLDEGSTHTRWTSLKDIGGGFPRHFLHGGFGGEPGDLDAQAARKALILAARTNADAVLLVRDSDGQPERRRGLEQARAAWKQGGHPASRAPGRPGGSLLTEEQILIAFAHPEREGWVIAGFEPRSPAEKKALERLRREFGFDPRTQAHRLRAGERDVKRVLATLTGGDPDRESACWVECGLNILRDRGALTGLASYLEEVRRLLVPVFTGSKAARPV